VIPRNAPLQPREGHRPRCPHLAESLAFDWEGRAPSRPPSRHPAPDGVRFDGFSATLPHHQTAKPPNFLSRAPSPVPAVPPIPPVPRLWQGPTAGRAAMLRNVLVHPREGQRPRCPPFPQPTPALEWEGPAPSGPQCCGMFWFTQGRGSVPAARRFPNQRPPSNGRARLRPGRNVAECSGSPKGGAASPLPAVLPIPPDFPNPRPRRNAALRERGVPARNFRGRAARAPTAPRPRRARPSPLESVRSAIRGQRGRCPSRAKNCPGTQKGGSLPGAAFASRVPRLTCGACGGAPAPARRGPAGSSWPVPGPPERRQS